MNRVVLVGVGGIGRRHFESLLKLPGEVDITLVDPAPQSLQAALSPGQHERGGLVTSCSSIDEIEGEFDLAIVATNSDVRLSVLQQLVSRGAIPNLVLEKVLFQSRQALEQAGDLISRNDIRAWVNCSRRVWPAYTEIRNQLREAEAVDLEVYGSRWGLACNGVHFLDLFAWLNDFDDEIPVEAGRLDGCLHPAKREGYVEFLGTLEASTGEATAALTCLPHGKSDFLISLSGSDVSITIHEKEGWCVVNSESEEPRLETFRPSMVSETTAWVADGILNGQMCGLPTYEESAQVHATFLTALRDKAEAISGSAYEQLPIT